MTREAVTTIEIAPAKLMSINRTHILEWQKTTKISRKDRLPAVFLKSKFFGKEITALLYVVHKFIR